MSSLETTILDALWEWSTTLLGSRLTAPDSQVVYPSEAQDIGDADVRPALPYIKITPIAPEIRVGQDEYTETLDAGGGPGGVDVLERTIRGDRYGTFSLTAYGDTAGGWLSDLSLEWRWHLTARRAAQTRGIAVRRAGTVSKVRVPLDNQQESRWSMEIEVAYNVVSSTTVDIGTAATAELSITLDSYPDDPDPVTLSTTIPLE